MKNKSNLCSVFEIPLSQGKVTVLDMEDFERVACYKWTVQRIGDAFYAKRRVIKNGKRTAQYLHRFILDAPNGIEVDHIDGNGLNNRRENLRLCSHAQNSRNQIHPHIDNTSGYKGISWHKASQSWIAQIGYNGKLIRWGGFTTKEAAARAYDMAAQKYFGEFARPNFPEESRKDGT